MLKKKDQCPLASNSVNFYQFESLSSRYGDLDSKGTCCIRRTWAKVTLFNTLLNRVMPLINFSRQTMTSFQSQSLSLGHCVSQLRSYILAGNKKLVEEEVMQNTSLSRECPPKIKIQRLLMAEENNNKSSEMTTVALGAPQKTHADLDLL